MFVKNKGENAYKSPINCKHVKEKLYFDCLNILYSIVTMRKFLMS